MFVTEPIAADVNVADDAVNAPILISANASPLSEKLTVPDGLVVASLNTLITPSEASLTAPANLRFVDAENVPAGLTAAEVTLAFVLSNVKVVVVGTALTTCVPLNVASTEATTTMSPTANPWVAAVVSVATFEVNALFVIVPVSVEANAVPYSVIRPRSTASVMFSLPTNISGSATARVQGIYL